MNIKFDTQTIRSINVFEEVAGVEVKDCLVKPDRIYFVVEEGKMGLAIGKNGKTVKKIQKNIGKNIKVYEYSEKPEIFIKNLVPTKVKEVNVEKEDGERVAHVSVDKRSKAVGKNGRNVKVMERFLNKEYGIERVKIE